MKSLDTNILVYAANEDAAEHPKALALVGDLLRSPDEWIIADQVLFETYRAVRNRAVVQKPMDASAAWELVNFYREEAGSRRCAFELGMWRSLEMRIKAPRFEARRTFDAVLAVTLVGNAVSEFYTRNVRDFEGLGFASVINPID